MNKTKIEYLSHSWNPIAMRCTPVSSGCRSCWHLRMAKRHAANPALSSEMREARGGGAPVLLKDELAAPLRLCEPAVIGVSFMGDLFHESVPFEWIDRVLSVVAYSHRRGRGHEFIVLTKRAARMLEYFNARGDARGLRDATFDRIVNPWPQQNLILGISIEDQPTADERIPLLLATPAAKRFISIEPMLDWVQLNGCRRCGGLGTITVGGYPGEGCCPDCDGGPLAPSIHDDGIHWVIAGAETGPGKRPAELDWSRSIRDQCKAAGTPFFFKVDSDGNHTLDNVLHEEMP